MIRPVSSNCEKTRLAKTCVTNSFVNRPCIAFTCEKMPLSKRRCSQKQNNYCEIDTHLNIIGDDHPTKKINVKRAKRISATRPRYPPLHHCPTSHTPDAGQSVYLYPQYEFTQVITLLRPHTLHCSHHI